MDDLVGPHQEVFVGKARQIANELLNETPVRHPMMGLVEFDVTKAREAIRRHKEATGEPLSFTAWLLKCIAQAASEHKEVHAYRKGRNRLVTFDDVDIGVPVERDVGGRKLPMGVVLRKVNEKSFLDIHKEIRAFQARPVQPSGIGILPQGERVPRLVAVFARMPRILRKIVWWKFRRDPILKKRMMGTIGVTAVGMYGHSGGWALTPGGYQSLVIAVGGISKRPVLEDGALGEREFLDLTLMLDHDVVDGAPAARFASRLGELLESGFALEL